MKYTTLTLYSTQIFKELFHIVSWNLGKEPIAHTYLNKVARLVFFFGGGGGYLPSLSINYVAMSKDMGKRLPQLYYITMEISYDLILGKRL